MLQPAQVTDYVPHDVANRDFSNVGCGVCYFHPSNCVVKSDACAKPGTVCGYFTPPFKPAVVDRHKAALRAFMDTRL